MAAPDSAGADLERAESLIRQALATSPLNPSAHFAKGRLLRAQRRCEDAIPEYEAVLAFNRNAVPAVMGLAICKFLTGSEDEVISFTEHAIGLSPRDPFLYLWYTRLGTVHFFQGRLDEAILWLEKARLANPRSPSRMRGSPPPTASKAIWLVPPLNSPKPPKG